MNSKNFRTAAWLALVAATLALLVGACAKAPRSAVGRLDTPEHHTLRGNDAIDEGKWEQAERSFNLALSLKKDHSGALAGKGVVIAHKAQAAGLSESQKRAFAKQAEDLVDDALDEAEGDDEERTAHIAGIRIYRQSKFPTDWVKLSQNHYILATRLDKRGQDPLPHFYMARAHRDAFQIGQASDLYRKVLEIDKRKTREAEREWAVVQKVQRAAPGSRHGKVIAFEESITRADISALFISELRLAALYSRGNNQQFDTGFKAASQRKQFRTNISKKVPDATDIQDHPMRADIEEVMRLRVLGLQPDPAHKFHPNAKTSRAEFAIMVEDILVKVTGETKLKTRFIGQASPFPDVRSTLPYYNAVQTVVSRGLMEVKNKARGVFAPLDPVAGADALLVIRLLKNELRSYLRPS